VTTRFDSDDRGETLLELVIAIVILGVCVVAIYGGFAASVRMTTIHRNQAGAGAAVHNYAETLANFIAAPSTPPTPPPTPPATTTTGYTACATAGVNSPYRPGAVSYTAPPNFTASVIDVSYWTGSAFAGSCPSPDKGVELVTLQVQSADQSAVEKVTIVVRKPCRVSDAPC
jgi:prepilin-type N-terminal cleavage/methylation domain-containing protein